MPFVGTKSEHLKCRARYALKSHKKYLQERSEYLGIMRYSYNEEEYRELRTLARQLKFGSTFAGNFGIAYKNIHAMNIPRLISGNRFNAFIGIFHDWSLREYYRMATRIEKTARDFGLPTISKSSDRLDDLSGILGSRYGTIEVLDSRENRGHTAR